MMKIGFTASDADNTVYFRFGNNNSIELAGWYINDELLTASSPKAMDQMVNNIRGSFKIQDLGKPE